MLGDSDYTEGRKGERLEQRAGVAGAAPEKIE
jgi:hypothetical protein